MHQLKIASLFGAILVAAAFVVMTMGALLLQFLSPGDHGTAWRSLVIALSGVGVALCLISLLHLGIIAERRISQGANRQLVRVWLGRWAAVAGGDAVEPPSASEAGAANAAAAQILQDFSGEAAARIRNALLEWGLVDRDLLLASGEGGLLKLRRVEALERLAWLAIPAAMPIFAEAAGSDNVREARAGLLGACRTLGVQPQRGQLGYLVVAGVAAHSSKYGASSGYRAFLSAALTEARDHLVWLCEELLGRDLPQPVRTAALDALADTLPAGTETVLAGALLSGLEGETLAAGLRAVARLGHVPPGTMDAVLGARTQPHAGARVQLAHALVGVAPQLAVTHLWELLGDRSFDVRFAAGSALNACGPLGQGTLVSAAESHPDAFARDMAAMHLFRNTPEIATGDLARALLTLPGTATPAPMKA